MPNINPKLWGPPAWKFISYVVASYSKHPSSQEMNDFRIFFDNLSHILPCSNCRNNYSEFLHDFPVTDHVLRDRHSLTSWYKRLRYELKKAERSGTYKRKY